MNRTRRIVLRSGLIGLLLAFLLTQLTSITFAMSATQRNVFNDGIGFFDVNAHSSASAASCSANLVGGDNQQKAFNYLVGVGLSQAQAAGVVGNMIVESGVQPDIMQGGSHSKTPPTKGGYGIVQWTPGIKLKKIITSANITGKPSSLTTQLEALWAQLSGKSSSPEASALADLKKQTTAAGAAVSFMTKYERPKDHSPTGANAIARSKKANQVLELYGSGCGDATQATVNDGCTSGSIECSSGSDNSEDLRQRVVCIAENELKTVWTPLPPKPRMQYLKYSDGAEEEWCADFTSWIYKKAGYSFTGGSSGGWRIASVSSVMQLGQQEQNFHWHAASSSYTPKPGDLAIYKGPNISHINIVVNVSGNTVTFIGGDQGSGPYGGPNSASDVSTQVIHGYYSHHIIGYVSPD